MEKNEIQPEYSQTIEESEEATTEDAKRAEDVVEQPEIVKTLKRLLRNTALTIMTAFVISEAIKKDPERGNVEKDKDASMENVPTFIQNAIAEFAKNNPDIVVTPQITLGEGKDVVIELAQVHADQAVSPANFDASKKDVSDCIECQNGIETFSTNMITLAKENNSKVLFFEEGNTKECSQDVIKVLEEYSKMLTASLLGKISMNMDEFESGIDVCFKNFQSIRLESIKYSIYFQAKEIILSSINIDEKIRNEALEKLDARIGSFDHNMIVYGGGGLGKLSAEGKIQVYTTESQALLDEGTDIFIKHKYESPEMNRLQKMLKDSGDDKTTSEQIMVAIKAEQSSIERANMEKREDVVVQNILKNIDLDDGNTDVVIVPFGAAHDFYNNFKNKGVTLIRINMLNAESREKWGIKE